MGETVDLHLGGYHLTESVGTGGMGSVFRATVEAQGKPVSQGTTVAVKVLHPHLRSIPEFVKRFHREARLASKIDHPNIIRMLDEGEDGRRHFIVMEFAEGLKLTDLIKDGTPLSPQQTIEVMNQVCDALASAASVQDPDHPGQTRHLVHRDIKPDNLIIQSLDRSQLDTMTRTGDKTALANIRVKLLDFGLAKDVQALSTLLSQTGQTLGTPAYMSPEQCRGEEVDGRSDLYSLGVVAYHLVTGVTPFNGPTTVAYAQQHAEEIPPDILKRNPLCPKPLADCIYRCLAKSPADRYQSPAELQADLARIAAGKSVSKIHRFKRKGTLSHLKLATIIGLSVAATIFMVIGLLWLLNDRARVQLDDAVQQATIQIAAQDYQSARTVLEKAIAAVPARADKAAITAAAHEKLAQVVSLISQQEQAQAAARQAALDQQAAREQAQREKEAAETKARQERFVKYRDQGQTAYNVKDYAAARLAFENALKEQADSATQKLLDDCLDRTIRHRIAVIDFVEKGQVGIPAAGQTIPEILLSRLSQDQYQLVERSQLTALLAEQNFTMAMVQDNPGVVYGKLKGVRYLILGSVNKLGNIVISARLVDITTGDIRQTAEVSAEDARGLQNALSELAKLLQMTNSEKQTYLDDKLYPQLLADARAKAAPPGKDYDAAIPLYQRALAIRSTPEIQDELKRVQDTRESEAREFARLLNQARTQAAAKDYLGAIDSYQKTLAIRQDAGVLAELRRLEADKDAQLAQLLAQARDHAKANRYDQALKDYASAQAIQTTPQLDREIQTVRQDKAAWDQKQAQEAAEALRQARIAQYWATALANDNKQNGKTALTALDELLKLDPGHAEAQKLRLKIAGYFGPSKVGDTITNSIGMVLTYIPAPQGGVTTIGSPKSEADRYDDEDQRQVRIAKPFLMGITEVTQKQWQAVMGMSIRDQRGKAYQGAELRGEGDDYPMYYVSWDDAQEFCRKLSQKEGRTYRLPTEAEWEYACRAGTTTRFSFGDADRDLDAYGWYAGNSNKQTHPVGQKKPNAWGLFDMHGNVWEWCEDWYEVNKYRVLRGGSWYGSPRGCRSANRNWSTPDNRSNLYGFRLLLDLSE